MKKVFLSLLVVCSLVFAQIEKADQLFKEGKYQEAEREYRKLVDDNNLYGGKTLLRIGQCLRLQGKYQEAIDELKKVYTLSVASEYYITEAMIIIASIYLNNLKDKEKALKECENFLNAEFSPQYKERVKYFYGLFNLQAGDVKGYNILKDIADNGKYYNDWASLKVAEYLYSLGKTQEAQEYFVKACLTNRVEVARKSFSYINPLILGKDRYKDLLEKMILTIPAKPENADFLSLLKSELEKMK